VQIARDLLLTVAFQQGQAVRRHGTAHQIKRAKMRRTRVHRIERIHRYALKQINE